LPWKKIIVTIATKQPHFASSKKNVKKSGISLSIIFCEQGGM